MDDLQRRFAALDRVDVPDLWPAIEDRARRSTGDAVAERVRGHQRSGIRTSRSFADQPMLASLVAIALISALVVGAVSIGAARFRSLPAIDPSVVVPSVAPSSLAVPSDVPPSAAAPSAVALAPSTAPAPSGGPTSSSGPTPSDAGACPARAAVPKLTETPIAVSSFVSRIVFSGCFGWARIAANNGGVAKIDLATNRVVDTIVPAEIVGDSLTSFGNGVLVDAAPSIIEPGTRIRLIRIDGATGATTDLLNLPVNGEFVVLGGQVWNRKFRSGELWVVPLDGSGPPTERGTIPPFIGAAFGSVWTQSTDGKRLERWDARGSVPSATVELPDAALCILADDGLACALNDGRVSFVSAATNAITWTVRITTSTDESIDLAAMNGSIWLQPALVQTGRVDAHELIELDETSGTVVRRLPLAVRQPLNLWAGGGDLWMSSAEQPLARVELPPR